MTTERVLQGSRTREVLPLLCAALVAAGCIGGSDGFGGGFGPAQDTGIRRPILLVASEDDQRLVIVDGRDGRVITDLPASAGPRAIAGAPDGGLGYVAAGVDNAIDIFNLVDGAPLRSIAVPRNGPFGIAVEDDGDVWVSFSGAPEVIEVDPDDGSFKRRPEVQSGFSPIVLSNRHDRLYSGGNGLSIVDLGTGTVTAIETPESVHDLALSSDESRVYGRTANGLFALDVASGEIVGQVTLDPPAGPVSIGGVRLAVSPDDREGLVAIPRAEVLVAVDLESMQEVRRLEVEGDPRDIEFGETSEIAFVSFRALDRLMILDVNDWLEIGRVTIDGPDALELVTRTPSAGGPRDPS